MLWGGKDSAQVWHTVWTRHCKYKDSYNFLSCSDVTNSWSGTQGDSASSSDETSSANGDSLFSMFSGPDLVAAVKQRRWAKWTEIDHFVRFLLFIYNFVWVERGRKFLPVRQIYTNMSLCATLVMWSSGFLKSVVLAAFSLFKPAPVQTASCSLRVSTLLKVWCFLSSMRVSFGCRFWGPYKILTELVWQRAPGCSWAVPAVVPLGASKDLSWLSCSSVALGRSCC